MWMDGPLMAMGRGNRDAVRFQHLTLAPFMRIFLGLNRLAWHTPPRAFKDQAMAKSNTVQIKLVSTADTGFFYVTKKNARAQTGKLEMRKYDPVVRKHVPFKEAKIK